MLRVVTDGCCIFQHQVLKRKLQSKSEALLIISKDLDTARNERDQFKLMAEKLQERCQVNLFVAWRVALFSDCVVPFAKKSLPENLSEIPGLRLP